MTIAGTRRRWALAAALTAGCAFGSASAKGDDLITQYLSEGDRQRTNGQPAQAAAQYEKALALDDANPEVYARLAGALVEAENFERAVKIFGRWIEIAPKDCRPRCGLAVAYQRQGLVDQAVKTYEDAVPLCPEDASAYAGLGSAYVAAKYPLEAIEAYRRSLELSPDDVGCYDALAKLYDGRALYPEAIGMYEAILARAGGEDAARVANAHERLAALYEWARACEKSIPHWEALANSPSADAAAKARLQKKIADCRDAHAATGVGETGGTPGR